MNTKHFQHCTKLQLQIVRSPELSISNGVFSLLHSTDKRAFARVIYLKRRVLTAALYRQTCVRPTYLSPTACFHCCTLPTNVRSHGLSISNGVFSLLHSTDKRAFARVIYLERHVFTAALYRQTCSMEWDHHHRLAFTSINTSFT